MKRQFISVLAVLTLLPLSGAAWAGWEEAVAAYQAGNYQAAVDEVGPYVEQAPDNWQGHWLLGRSLVKLGRGSEGLSSLRKAYDLDPNQPQVWFHLADAYMANGRAADAAALLQQVDTGVLPANAKPAYNQLLAKALADSGQRAAALRPLREAANANPNNARAQFAYGAAAQNAGELDAAAAALGKAVELDGNNPEYLRVYAKALITQGRLKTGNAKVAAYRGAIPVAEKLHSIDSGYESLKLLGDAQLGAKDYAAAVNTYRQATQQSGADWESYYSLGQAYTKQTRYSDAIAALEQARSKTSDREAQGKIWGQLGFIYEKQDNFDGAILAYQNAGDSSAVNRVQQNRDTAEYNEEVEQENAEAEARRREEERIKRELEELPGGRQPDAR